MKHNKSFQITSSLLVILILINLLPQKAFANPDDDVVYFPPPPQTEIAPSNTISGERTSDEEPVQRLGEINEKRTRNTKFFMNSDMTTTAEVYSNSIHYPLNGNWEEIDNTIIEDMSDPEMPLRNKANDMVVKLARNFTGNKLVSVKLDNYSVSISPLNGDKAKAEITDNSSTVVYKNIYPNIDFEYVVDSDMVKENIILHKYTGINEFTFQIHSPHLIPRLIDNTVIFTNDTGEEQFKIPAPYMYDSAHQYSDDIIVSLDKQTGPNYTLSYTVKMEWLQDATRQYPVVIDPAITTSRTDGTYDAYVSSGSPNNNYGYTNFLTVGKHLGNEYRAFLKWTQLPELGAADVIVNAELKLTYDTSDWTYVPLYVHEINSPWDSQTVTWNSQPDTDTIILDYATFSSGCREINITSLVKKWYQTGSCNGIMLKTTDNGIIEFYTFDHLWETYRPYISITYTNSCGLEDFYSYTTMEMGRSGTVNINNYSGNMVFTHSDISLPGNRLPLQINHVYNANSKDENIGYGNGWRLNLSQTVTNQTIGNSDYILYTDGDGTVHYFLPIINSEPRLETPGVNLKLTINDDNYIITDSKDNKLHFSLGGNLTKIEDNQGNIITIEYQNNRIISVEDGSGRLTTLTYNPEGNLSMITDPSQRQTQYQYFDGNLTQITYSDGLSTDFAYNINLMQTVNRPANQQLNIHYYPDYSVQNIAVRGSEGNIGQTYSFAYDGNTTDITDVNGQTFTYQFNHQGNAVNIVDPKLNAAHFHYDNNLVMHAVPFQSTTTNLLKNHDMAEDRDWDLLNENSSATGDNYWDGGYFGYSSLQISKADLSGRSYFSQGHEIPAGTYTLSGYVKTSELTGEGLGAALLIKYCDGSGSWNEVISPGLKGTQEWQRLHVTFTIPEGTDNTQIIVGLMVEGTTGTAWFDCVQLETGLMPTNYNLLENSSFESGYWNPDNWSSTEALFGTHSLVLHGDESYEDSSRTVENRTIRSSKDNIFVISGWAKANSVPKGNFQLVVRFSDTYNRNSVDYYIPFDKSTTDWQYTSAVIEAPYGWSYTISVDYRYNSNTAYFDGIQMTKAGTQSFTYDSNFNLTSLKNTTNQQTYFSYNPSNDLTKVTTPTNQNYDYFYDTEHNLLSTLSPTGNSNSYSYDEYGNLTSAVSGQLAKENYIKNGHFSGELYPPWCQTQMNDTGNISLSSDYSVYGTESLYVQSNHTGQAGHVGAYQQVTVEDNQTYTFSLWQKTNLLYSNASLVVEQYSSGTTPVKTDTLSILTGENDWIYRSATFTTAPDVSMVKIHLRIEREITYGLDTTITEEAWFDGIQMELHDTPSIYNYLYNSDFRSKSGYIPKGYEFITDSGYIEIYSSFTSSIKNYYVKLTALHPTNQGYLDINQSVSLKPSTRYTASFWVKGVGLTNSNQVIAEAICEDANGLNEATLFTSSVDEESFDWRKISVTFTTPANASKLGNFRLGFVNPGKGELWYGNLSLKEQGATEITYTSNGNYPLTVTNSAGELVAAYDYDLLSGNLNSVTDIKGNVQAYTYDVMGRVISVTDQTSGISQSYEYHETDNIQRICRSNFDYLFNYDEFGRRTTVSIDANGVQSILATNNYSNVGALTSTSFGNGQTIEYTYDNMYRLDSVQHGGITQYSYRYDAQGNTVMAKDNVNSVTTWYGYDLANRLVNQRDSNGQYVEYDYDKENNITSIRQTIDGITFTTNYTYNIDNNIDKVTTSSGDVYEFHRIENRLPLRTVLTPHNGNPIESHFTYNSKDQLIRLENSLDSYYYEYDLAGNITDIVTDTCQAGYAYDSLNQLTSETITRDGITTVTEFTYDSHGNMTNRTEGTKETLYTYHLDRLVQIEEKTDGVTTSTQTLTYDNAGNLITDGEFTYTWELGRQLKGITGADLTTSYKYNENGLRTEKTVNGMTHEYTLLGSSVTREVIRDAAGEIIWTIHYSYAGDSTPVSMNVNGTEYYYLKNAQGDITHIVNGDGNEVASYEYDAWGNHLSITGGDIAQLNPYRYRGYRYDSETGLYYLQSRYYNPEWGRFINVDSMTDGGAGLIGANLFLYGANNPINNTDPTGQWIIKDAYKKRVTLEYSVIQMTRQYLNKFSITRSTGIYASGSFGPYMTTFQCCLSTDTKGNYALQLTFAGGLTGGSPFGGSAGFYSMTTNASTVDKLNGEAIQAGGSLGLIPVSSAFEVNCIPDSYEGTAYWGATKSIGIGTPGGEGHIEGGNTWTIKSFNLYNFIDKLFIRIME